MKDFSVPRFADVLEREPEKELKAQDVIDKFKEKFGIKG